jgi:hypothetical protein
MNGFFIDSCLGSNPWKEQLTGGSKYLTVQEYTWLWLKECYNGTVRRLDGFQPVESTHI